MSQQIKKKFLGPDQIGSDQILIEDGQALRGMDGATEVELVKISSSEVYLNGIKVLNSSDLIPADILPSYVDDVLEYADLTAIQAISPGEAGKIYVALDTNKCYRWSGSTYIQITSGAVDSVNGSTGVVVLDSSDIGLSSPVNGETTVQGSLEDLEGRIDDLEIGGGDTKEIKISANDSTPGYLEDKVVGAAGKISISTLNDGANEDLQISIGADVFDKTVDDTDDISEGTSNLFFTDARAKSAAVSDAIVDNVTDVAPSQNAVFDALALKFDSADFSSDFDANLALKDTDDLAEGSNLYFTDARAKSAAVSDSITDGVTDVAPSQNAVFDALALVSGDVSNHIDDTEDAHDASAISFDNSTLGIVADNVQDALDELSTNVGIQFEDLYGASPITISASPVALAQNIHHYEFTGAFPAITQNITVFTALELDDVNDGEAFILINRSSGTLQLRNSDNSANITDGTIYPNYTARVVQYGGSYFISKSMILGAGAQNAAFLKIINLGNGTLSTDAVNKGQLDAKVADIITDGVTTVAPSQNAVFDALALKLNLAGGTMSGNIAMGNNSITNLVMTSDAHSAATRQYVDSVAEGLHVHAPARLLANVDLGGTYNNGVDGVGAHIDFSSPIVSIDGVTSFSVGDRIILAFQNGNAADLENGIYFIEDAADIDVNGYITKLTRTVDFNSPAEMAGGDFVFVQEGSQYADTGWVMTETVVAVGTTPVKFLQFSGAGSYTAGDGLDLLGTVFSVNVSEIAGSGLQDDGSNNLELTDTGVSAASYGTTAAKTASFTVDAQGRLTLASEQDIDIASTQINDFQSAVRAEISVADTNSIDLSYSSGEVSADLKLDPVNSALSIGISGLSLANTTVSAASYGTTAAKTASFTVDAQGRLTAASEQDISIVSTQMSDFQTAVRAEVSAGDGLDYSAVSGEFSVDLKAAGGLKIDATELAVEPADFAGDGLEDDGSDNLKIKRVFTNESTGIIDLSLSASGISVANRWGKESYVVIAADTVLASDYYDLDHEIEANSLVAFVDRLGIHEGVDYNLSVVSGVTRVTFIGDLIGPGPSQLASGDRLTFTYQKKAKA